MNNLLLTNEPVYLAATLIAENTVETGSWREDFHFEIAAWSSEINAFSQALVDGYKANTVSFQELNIYGDIGNRPMSK